MSGKDIRETKRPLLKEGGELSQIKKRPILIQKKQVLGEISFNLPSFFRRGTGRHIAGFKRGIDVARKAWEKF